MHHVQVSMHTPAPLVTRTVLKTARTSLRIILCLRNNPTFKPSTRCHELKNGCRRINSRNSAVRERPHGIKRHMSPAPVAFTLFKREYIRIQTRRRNHRQNFTIARVNCDQSPLHRIGNRRFSSFLQLQVNRRNHVQAGFRRNKTAYIRKRSNLASRGIHFHKLEPVFPAELLIVFLLQSLLPNAIALRIRGVFRKLQLLFRNFTRVAKHMRCKRPVRVLAARLDNHGNAGQLRRMLFDHRHLLHCGIFQNADRTRAHPTNPLECGIERKRIEKTHTRRILNFQQTLENRIPPRLFAGHFEGLERYLVRGAVTHQHLAIAVVNVAAIGNQLNSTQAVVFGTLEVLFVMDVLQRKQLEQNHRKKDDRRRQENQDVPVSADTRFVFRLAIHSTSSPK